MSQLLIVEGNDAIVLASLLRKRELPSPVGYSKKKNEDFKKFVKIAGGKTNIPIAIELALNSPDLKNLGIIIDADETGFEGSLDSILRTIRKNIEFEEDWVEDLGTGKIIKTAALTIGIWIMPDNQNTGYLEHFLANLVPKNDSLFTFAQQQIEALNQQNLQIFSNTKKQKALLHTWLAWQKDPGKPFGQAAESGYFDLHATQLIQFEEWFKGTFELENNRPSTPTPAP